MSSVPMVRVHRSLRAGVRLLDSDRLRWFDEAAAAGPLVGLRVGPATSWILTDAVVSRQMLVGESADWRRPSGTRLPIRMAIGDNLFTQGDDDWARFQPTIAPLFRRRTVQAQADAWSDLIDDEVAAIPRHTPVDLDLVMARLVVILAAWVLLGERLDRDRADELAGHQREITTWIGNRMGSLAASLPFASGVAHRRMREHRMAIDAYLEEVITQNRGPRRPVKGTLLEALLLTPPNGHVLPDGELCGQLRGLLLGGIDTTAAALSWALVHGSRHPHEWSGLRQDPSAVHSYVDETLRLTPAVWGFTRTPAKTAMHLVVDGTETRIRRGQVLTVYLRGMNRDPRHWPDPLAFNPSRHLAATKVQQRSMLPFGLGPRGCIGQNLALAEITALLPALARHGIPVVEGETVEDPTFALRIQGGLRGMFLDPPADTTQGSIRDPAERGVPQD